VLFLILISVAAGVYIGFAAPPSGRSVLLVTGVAVLCFLAALGIDGWALAWKACGVVVAVPLVSARMAATKWSTPDVYDDD
jgi:hypothetical protein